MTEPVLDRRLFERHMRRAKRAAPYSLVSLVASLVLMTFLSFVLAARLDTPQGTQAFALGMIHGATSAASHAWETAPLRMEAAAGVAVEGFASFAGALQDGAVFAYRALSTIGEQFLSSAIGVTPARTLSHSRSPQLAAVAGAFTSANDAAASTSTSATSTDEATGNVGSAVPGPTSQAATVVNQYITQPVVERVVSASPVGYVTQAQLQIALQQQENSLRSLIYQASWAGGGGSAPSSPVSNSIASGGVWNAIAASNKIDNLSGTSLTNVTVNGVSGLTDADIPDNITASNYLPLAGGTLAGDLTITGNLTTSGTQTFSGALSVPYINATSTSATSTFSGGLAGNGYVALATTTITGGLTVNGNTNITSGGQLTVGDKVIAPGEIGVGTTSPYAKLAVQGTSVATTTFAAWGYSGQTAPLVDVFNSAGNNFFRITSAGNIGIGTTTPWRALSVAGASDLGWNALAGYFTATSSTASSLPYASSTAVTVSGTAYFPGSGIWNTSGNVGIGTTSPAALLGLESNGAQIYLKNTSGSVAIRDVIKAYGGANSDDSGSRIVLGSENNESWGAIGAIRRGGDKGLEFFAGISLASALRIQSTGNVGIGTTSPGSKLDVLGGGSGVTDAISSTGRFINTASAGSNARLGVISGTLGAAILDLGDSAVPDTGGILYDNSVNSLAFKTSGTSKVTILSTGNVGIGTTSPWAKLGITGSGVSTGLAFAVADSTNSPKFVIQDQGNVGIGTVSPGELLEVAGTSASSTALLRGGLGGYGGILKFYSNINGGGNYYRSSISGITSNSGSALTFSTTNNGNTDPTEWMRITKDGNVGIGTTNPTEKLTVQSGNIRINSGDLNINGSNVVRQSGNYPLYLQTDTTNPIIFRTSIASEKMRITNDGNVGIGTTAPNDLFTVIKTDGAGDPTFTIGNDQSNKFGRISYSDSVDIFAIQGGVWGGTTRPLVLQGGGGNVGIGTTSPLGTLHVGNSASDKILVGQSNGVYTMLGVGNSTDPTTGGAGAPVLGMFGGSTSWSSANSGFGMFYLASNGNLEIWRKVSSPSSASQVLTIQRADGNVGIGTTGPGAKLDVQGGTNQTTFISSGFAQAQKFTSDWDAYLTALSGRQIFFQDGGDTNMVIGSSGNVGIGTTNPSTFKLQVAGNVGPDASNSYNLGGAGSNWGCLYYNGGTTGTCASDERLKTNIQDFTFTDPLAQLAGLEVRSFAYKTATSSIYHGLIAQEVEKVAPELVETDASTTLKSVKYGDIQWLVVSAVQALIAKVQALADTVAGFAQSITSAVGNFGKVNTNELCVGSTCVTPAQFQAMVAAVNGTQTSQTAAVSVATSGPPVIALNGNNPAQVAIGATYNDLGARITGPTQADTNLGLQYFVDGTAVTTVQIDTATSSTHTIDYVATNSFGTATSTRTVVVGIDAASPTADIAATSTATTSTDATSTSETDSGSTQEDNIGNGAATTTSATSTDSTTGNIGTGATNQ